MATEKGMLKHEQWIREIARDEILKFMGEGRQHRLYISPRKPKNATNHKVKTNKQH